jgi:chitin disaccharide deacetylase
MGPPEPLRRLIVNADDFGRSAAINRAIVSAHREGILTSASLMVNEPGCDEAVKMARDNPRLGVGLHLTLICGRAASPPEEIPGLADSKGGFSNHPVAAGCRYFFSGPLKESLRREIRAQFERFFATGLALDHVNGHLNMHLHPVVLNLLLDMAKEGKLSRMRLTKEPFFLNARHARGKWGYRISHALVYRALSHWARPRLAACGIRHTERVFGLLQNGRVDERYLERLCRDLPAGDSELYSHPSPDVFKHEWKALISPRVRDIIQQRGIRLIRYQDL